MKKILEKISPIWIKPTTESITISFSRRFFLFEMMKQIVAVIEEDPHLNFIALLKSYKVLGKFLHGTLHEFYRDRNKVYFRKFFYDKKLYELVKSDIEYFYPKYQDVRMTITKRGIIIYDNYKKNMFNTLLMTIHSGSWVPEKVEKKLIIPPEERKQEEDIDTHKIYSRIVLDKGGIWIDNKQSRFVIDLNRSFEKAVYEDSSEAWIEHMWKEKPSKSDLKDVHFGYNEFYFTLSKIVESYNFNIIFDGHSMKDLPGRPTISLGTKYIPKFYIPIVRSMRQKIVNLGYKSVLMNAPFQGGHILQWFSRKFPSVFIFSMELNKNLYMTQDRTRSVDRRVRKISKDLVHIFDIEIEDE